MPVIKCSQCGNEFYIRPGRVKKTKPNYCSRRCAGEAKSTLIEKECPWCETKFMALPSGATYCSKSCAGYASHASKGRTYRRHCSVCGKGFTNGTTDTICSKACYAKFEEEQASKCLGFDRALIDDPWQLGHIPPVRYADDLYYTPSFEAGF